MTKHDQWCQCEILISWMAGGSCPLKKAKRLVDDHYYHKVISALKNPPAMHDC